MNNQNKIKNMFNEISSKYDFMNSIISFGLHKIVKKYAIKKLKIEPESNAVDLCCGTGDISKLLAKNSYIKEVIGIDFSDKMLEIARAKNSDEKIKYINADCLKVPFEDSTFDLATMFFGLRNIEDKDLVLKEVRRVLKNDGQFLLVDFISEKSMPGFLYNFWVKFSAFMFRANKSAYEYLISSKEKFTFSKDLKSLFTENKLEKIFEKRILFSNLIIQIYKITDKIYS